MTSISFFCCVEPSCDLSICTSCWLPPCGPTGSINRPPGFNWSINYKQNKKMVRLSLLQDHSRLHVIILHRQNNKENRKIQFPNAQERHSEIHDTYRLWKSRSGSSNVYCVIGCTRCITFSPIPSYKRNQSPGVMFERKYSARNSLPGKFVKSTLSTVQTKTRRYRKEFASNIHAQTSQQYTYLRVQVSLMKEALHFFCLHQ